MATTSVNYGTSTAITCSLAGLTALTGWQSSVAVDNQTNLFMDALVGGSIQVGSGISADGTLEVYLYGSWDGTEYSGGLAGTDTTISWGLDASVNGASMLSLIAVLNVDATDDDVDIKIPPRSVASAFGGVMPRKWGVVIHNNTNANLHATGTNNSIEYTGIKYDSA